MTSMPASRRARAMILAPRSWPSRPGFATTTRIFRFSVSGMRRRRIRGSRGHRRTRRHPRGTVPGVGALACGLIALVLAGSGGRPMETTLQDDAIFLHRSPAVVRAAARTVAALGADRLRLTAGWRFIAPRADSS